jgi:hypothetical protein
MKQASLCRAIVPCAAALMAALGCGGGQVVEGPCAASEEACEYSTVMSEITLQPGEETDELCQSWTLDNPQELWVTTVAMENSGGYHHSNWFFVPDDAFALADGAWPCSDNDFTELVAAVLGGFLFAQSTQSSSEVQSFAQGAAIRVPPYSRVIGSTHLLNASDQPLTTRLSLRITTAPAHEVAVKLVPARIEYRDLDIPPNAVSEFTAECDLAAAYQEVMGAPFQFTLYHVLPHYHELGIYFQFEIVGGQRDGDIVYRHEGYGSDTFGKSFDPPIDFAALGATGIRFTCGFSNPRAESVGWGIGDQEMCVTAIFADTGMGFEGNVAAGSGEVVGVAEDGTIMHQGPCTIFGLPWNHDKQGGPPRSL